MAKPFRRLLIANRGEIACRIMRTAKRMGIWTIAVFSDADHNAMHVALADEARHIGLSPVRESYLAIDRIIEAAKASGAEAIHPGYGFLSENADFAERCTKEGLIFVGPTASAMLAMGSKSAAKQLMSTADVPLVPGYHGDNQDAALLAAEAAKIGYPVLVKASAGGGGKGMRIVEKKELLAEALESAKREAKSAFGDDHMLIEKYLKRPRHIEVQVFGDTHGNILSLFERECTLQRRHQKVIEEAPSATLTADRREAILKAARNAAKSVNYVGAGTIEFIADDGGFYFIEMNTRLQVEHPVTEMITGLDLVEWQLRVAMGEELPLRQEQITRRGHAIECRVYAEDSSKGFLPSIGRLTAWHQPQTSNDVRIDAGFRAGDRVTQYYDPMLAKLIVWAEDRQLALSKTAAALGEFHVAGVATNIAFLETLVTDHAVANNVIDTGLIERELEGMLQRRGKIGPLELAAVAAAVLTGNPKAEDSTFSPWNDRSGWMLSGARKQQINLHDDTGQTFVAEICYTRHGMRLGTQAFMIQPTGEGIFVISLDGLKTRVFASLNGAYVTVGTSNGRFHLTVTDPFAATETEHAKDNRIVAPMPGSIIRLHAKPGAQLERGDPVLTLEAMKMEHTLKAPAKGKLTAFNCATGDIIQEGTILAEFELDSKT